MKSFESIGLSLRAYDRYERLFQSCCPGRSWSSKFLMKFGARERLFQNCCPEALAGQKVPDEIPSPRY